MPSSSARHTDLAKHHLSDAGLSIQVRLDLSKIPETSSENPDQGKGALFQGIGYSVEDRHYLHLFSSRRHLEDQDRYLLEIRNIRVTKLPPQEELEQDFSGPAFEDVWAAIREVENSRATLEYQFENDSEIARRIPLAFPVLQDPLAMYTLVPADSPLDKVFGMAGIKNEGQEDEYTVALSVQDDYTQLMLGFPVEASVGTDTLLTESIRIAGGHLRKMGLLGKDQTL